LGQKSAGIQLFHRQRVFNSLSLSKVVLEILFNYRTREREYRPVQMKPNPQLNQTESEARGAAAEYIALEASRLARIANAKEFPLLAYLIDMVVLEAWREANETESAGPDDVLMGADGG
jgi:hypothetical protein